eukprot:1011744-Amorphochlora_amoeboformis.AAC.2
MPPSSWFLAYIASFPPFWTEVCHSVKTPWMSGAPESPLGPSDITKRKTIQIYLLADSSPNSAQLEGTA